MYGCEAVLPIESRIPIARHTTVENNSIDLNHEIDALEGLRESAFLTMASQKQAIERHFNKNVRAKVFQVGDYILRRVFQNTQELNAGKYLSSGKVRTEYHRLLVMVHINLRPWTIKISHEVGMQHISRGTISKLPFYV